MNERLADSILRREGLRTIAERYDEYHLTVKHRLLPYFGHAGIPYPPDELVFAAIKNEKVLQVYASSPDGFRFIRTYPILAASGELGPKLREGDRQVPEGIYAIEKLNPNSAYHLALRVAYPNEFDIRQAQLEHRTNLGSDIMIHGSDRSAGCLAMGDRAAEDLFILAAEVGVTHVKLIISPIDFRKSDRLPQSTRIYPFSSELYDHIKRDLSDLPSPNP